MEVFPTGGLDSNAAGTGGLSPSAMQLMIQHAASQYNIPPEIISALIQQESSGRTHAVGAGGEIGLGQFMPGTAKALGIDPSDPSQAIPGIAMYLRQNLNRFGGNMDQALAAYNWGPGNVAKFGMANAPQSVRNYVARIMGSKGVPAPSGGAPASQAPTQANTPLAMGPVGGDQPMSTAQTTSPGPNMALAQLQQQQGGGLGNLMANAALDWQQQAAKNAGLA